MAEMAAAIILPPVTVIPVAVEAAMAARIVSVEVAERPAVTLACVAANMTAVADTLSLPVTVASI